MAKEVQIASEESVKDIVEKSKISLALDGYTDLFSDFEVKSIYI